jgi:Leucine-rich repeat (LRR) protein
MCIVCTYDETTDVSKITELLYCSNVSVIPDTFVNLTYLSCYHTNITSIPDTFVNLTYLYCPNTNITSIPDTFVNLTYLICRDTKITSIPDTFVNLTQLSCRNTKITSIPDNQYEYINTINCKWLKRNYTTLLWNKRIRKINILQRLWKWKKVYKKVPLCRDLREYVVKPMYILGM